MTDNKPRPLPSIDFARWEADRKAQTDLAATIRPANKQAVFDALAAARITSVIVTFDGCGDSGQIESIDAKAGDAGADLPHREIPIASVRWGDSEPTTVTMTVSDAIEQLAYDYLSETHCGWENNDGAYGEFVFDVTERTITLDHNDRYTAVESYSHEF